MELNKFQLAFLHKQSGLKSKSTADRAEIATSSTRGILTLNSAALNALEVEAGDRVLIYDLRENASSPEDRFFITKGFKIDKTEYGPRIGKNRNILDLQIYYALYGNNLNLDYVTQEELVAGGIGFFRKTAIQNSVFAPYQKITMELVIYTETDEQGKVIDKFSPAKGIASQSVYRLCNIVRTDFHYTRMKK